MDFLGVDIVCPACRAELSRRGGAEQGSLHCMGCGRAYPVLAGIPDLRLWPDPYIGMAEDRAKGETLARECAGRSFLEAVRFYYSVTHAVPPFQARRFERGLAAAAERSRESLARWESLAPAAAGTLSLLDIGCGTAPLLVHAAGRYRCVAGVDVAFRWLVLARCRLVEAGLHVPLVCACAEALPFGDRLFDRVVADSTLEHLRDGPLALREVRRVLRPAGAFFVATPNRFSLGPDPHTGLPAGGWLPDRAVAAYVRRKGGVPPRRTLYSGRSLRRLFREAGLAPVGIYPPSIPAAIRERLPGAGRALVTAYNGLLRVPGARTALRWLGPLLHAVAVPSDPERGRLPNESRARRPARVPSPAGVDAAAPRD
ncbi:MAG TPA: methyltransferase domain-containing protein [Gemmatimonadaceae bacterium]|nr:methyltransferase domain-containing protein [Gemmatimonadaceae bacterium]